ncbi:MAG: DUF2029 domain-containing protein [Anaerolineae bacterium]|nr:DUF2029 domain-containing protein [Anaerolineae bacterium]
MLFTLLLAFILALNVTFTQRIFTSRFPGANDFFSRWEGARVFWQEGLSPYSQEATLSIQRGIYGRPAYPYEDQGLFVYPFYTVFFLFPLVWFPYSWVQAFWMVLLEFLLLTGFWLCIDLFRWRPPLTLLALTGLWTILFYYHARAIILGQFAVVVFFFLALSLWALSKRKDFLAGASLALTTFKPQMVFLAIPFLLLWSGYKKRWSVIKGFTGVMALLLGLSWIAEPHWFQGFLSQVRAYPAYTIFGSPLWILTSYYFPALGKPVEVILTLALLILLGYFWALVLKTENEFVFHQAFGLTLVVTNLIAPRTATTNYVVFLIPICFLFSLTRRHLWIALGEILSLPAFWALFILTVKGDFEQPPMYIPPPFILLAALLIQSSRFRMAFRI